MSKTNNSILYDDKNKTKTQENLKINCNISGKTFYHVPELAYENFKLIKGILMGLNAHNI